VRDTAAVDVVENERPRAAFPATHTLRGNAAGYTDERFIAQPCSTVGR